MGEDLTVEGDIVTDLQARSLAYNLLRKYPLAEQAREAEGACLRWGQLLEYPSYVIVRAVASWHELAR